MSTNPLICKQYSDGSIGGIYCHWDGYPEHVGVLLQEHYSDNDILNKLIKLGNISSLGKDIDTTDAYCRDEHSEWNDIGKYANCDELLEHNDIEYIYVFDGKEWLLSDHGRKFIKFSEYDFGEIE